jgi:hypothetical protein
VRALCSLGLCPLACNTRHACTRCCCQCPCPTARAPHILNDIKGQPLLLGPTNWKAQPRPRTRMDLRHATVWVASVLRMLRCAQGQEAGARVLHAISHGTTPCCVPQTARQHVTPSERAQPCGVPHCRGGEPCCVRCVRPGGRLQACSAWMQVHDAPLGAPLG